MCFWEATLNILQLLLPTYFLPTRKTNHVSFLGCRKKRVESCQWWKYLGKVWAILTIIHLFCIMNGKPALLYENINACWGTCIFFETLWDKENKMCNETTGTPKTLIKERFSSSLAAQGQCVLSRKIPLLSKVHVPGCLGGTRLNQRWILKQV